MPYAHTVQNTAHSEPSMIIKWIGEKFGRTIQIYYSSNVLDFKKSPKIRIPNVLNGHSFLIIMKNI